MANFFFRVNKCANEGQTDLSDQNQCQNPNILAVIYNYIFMPFRPQKMILNALPLPREGAQLQHILPAQKVSNLCQDYPASSLMLQVKWSREDTQGWHPSLENNK